MNSKILLTSFVCGISLSSVSMALDAAVDVASNASPTTVAATSTTVTTTAVETNAAPAMSESMDASLGVISRRIDEQKTRLQQKVRAYHGLVESPEDTPDLVFLEKDQSLPKRKAQALRMMELAIRYALEDLDRLEIQKSELVSEIEWRRVQESTGTSSTTSDALGSDIPGSNIAASKCQILPLDVDPLIGTKILQDFGPREDVASGLKWESHGWWIGHIHSPVRACRPGKVSYVGTVPGRGRVVIIDHGQGGMTLYANMKEDVAERVKVGNFVSTGTIVGEVGERLYFEVRQNGRAVTPRDVFNSEQVAKLKLNPSKFVDQRDRFF